MPHGDLHNFGKRVEKIGRGWLQKPRSVHWEWLILDSSSPIRSLLNGLFDSSNLCNPYSSIPNVTVAETGRMDGRVQFIAPSHDFTIETDDWQKIGAVTGLCTFLGISDLHYENILAGNVDGRFVFLPIDIESVLDPILLPSNTLITFSGKQIDAYSGIRTAAGKILDVFLPGSIAAICQGYLTVITHLLDNIELFCNALLDNSSLSNAPLRCCLRPTPEYHALIKNELKQKKLKIPLLTSEIEQLRRNEIPYYWRFFNDNRLFYYDSPDRCQSHDLDLIIDQFRIPIQSSVDSWKRYVLTNRETIVKAGCLQVAKYLMQFFRVAHDKWDHTEISFKRGYLKVDIYNDKFMAKVTDANS